MQLRKNDVESTDSVQALSILTLGRRESHDMIPSLDNTHHFDEDSASESLITLIGASRPKNEAANMHPNESFNCCLFPTHSTEKQNSRCNLF